MHSSPCEARGLWDWDSVRMEHVKRNTKYIDILTAVHTRAEVSAEFRRESYGRGYGMAVLSLFWIIRMFRRTELI